MHLSLVYSRGYNIYALVVSALLFSFVSDAVRRTPGAVG